MTKVCGVADFLQIFSIENDNRFAEVTVVVFKIFSLENDKRFAAVPASSPAGQFLLRGNSHLD